jgi:CHAT domain-containing protein
MLFGAAFNARADDASSCAAIAKTADTAGAIACWQRLIAGNPEPRARAEYLTNIAWLHTRIGDYTAALTAFRETLTISREIGDRALEASTVNFIGLIHQFLNDPKEAMAHDRRALALATEIGDRKLQEQALYQLGWVHFVQKDYATAIRYYNDAVTAAREAGDRKGEGIVLTGLGMTYSSLGQYEKTLQYENEALTLLRESGETMREADALDHIGLALTLLHRPREAIPYHTQALELRKAHGGRWGEPFSLSSLARAHREMGDVAAAAADMSEVIKIVEEGRRRLPIKRFRGSLFAGMWGHYARYIGLLMELHDDAGAFAMSERARARLTLDAVQETLARTEASAGRPLLAREDALRDEIDSLERSRDAAGVDKAREIGQQIEARQAVLLEVERRIRETYPKLEAARNAEPLATAQIQTELLDDDSAVVEYFLGSEKSFAWILTRASIESFELPPRSAIEASALEFRELLAAGDQRSKRHDLDAAGAKLSSIIVAPLRLPRAARRLIIVPDGALFYIPFAALASNGLPLIDQFEIAMAPSASALVLLRRSARMRPNAEGMVAVFADPVFRSDDPRVHSASHPSAPIDPDLVRSARENGLRELRRLPATRAEAHGIVRVAAGRAREALDFDANRRVVLQADLSRYRIVHFATHALVNAQHPELSGIVLSLVDRHGAPVDGFLRVHDLYALKGSSELVVLSACRTSAGKELRGEGIVGLVSGFMHAGTSRIVASYWNVQDEATAEMMQRFYRAMFAGGLSPASALRSAQRSMRAEERWRAPYHWASFALYGLP